MIIDYKAVIDTDVGFLKDYFAVRANIAIGIRRQIPTFEAHKLYTYLSNQFNNALIIDLGTGEAISALCFAQNKSNQVVSYDILPERTFWSNNQHSPIQLSNLKFVTKNTNDLTEQEVADAALISLDISHNGEDEKKFFEFLKFIKFKGYVVCDDSYWDTLKFMNNLDWPIYDLTLVGHTSGTVLIDCGRHGVEIIPACALLP